MDYEKNVSGYSFQEESIPSSSKKTWKWLVIATTFFIRVTVTSLSVSYGVVYFTLIEREDMSHAGASLVIAVFVAVNCISSPISTWLSLHYSPRKLIFLGMFSISLGLALCSISLSVPWLLLCYGVLGGIGSALTNSNTFLITQKYLGKRRATANTFASLGTSVSFVIMPLIVYVLIKQLSLRGMFLMWSSITMQGLIGSMFYRVPQTNKRTKDTMFISQPLSVFRQPKNKFRPDTQDTNKQQSFRLSCTEKDNVEVIVGMGKPKCLTKVFTDCGDLPVGEESECNVQTDLLCKEARDFTKILNNVHDPNFAEGNDSIKTNMELSNIEMDDKDDSFCSDDKYRVESSILPSKGTTDVRQSFETPNDHKDYAQMSKCHSLNTETHDLPTCSQREYGESNIESNHSINKETDGVTEIPEKEDNARLAQRQSNVDTSKDVVSEEPKCIIETCENERPLICAEEPVTIIKSCENDHPLICSEEPVTNIESCENDHPLICSEEPETIIKSCENDHPLICSEEPKAVTESCEDDDPLICAKESIAIIESCENDHPLISTEHNLQEYVVNEGAKELTNNLKDIDDISIKSLPHNLEGSEFDDEETYFDLESERHLSDVFRSTCTISLESFHTVKSHYLSTENIFASLEYIDIVGNLALNSSNHSKVIRSQGQQRPCGPLVTDNFKELVPILQPSRPEIGPIPEEDIMVEKPKADKTTPFVLCGIELSTRNNLIGLMTMKKWLFFVCCISSIVNKQVHLTFIIYLPLIAAEIGCKSSIPFLLGIVSISELIAKFASSYVCRRKCVPLYFLHIIISTMNSLLCLALIFCAGFWSLALASTGIGLGMGILVTTDPGLLMEHFSSHLVTHTYRLILFVGAVFSLVMFPVQGWTVDTTGNFRVVGVIMSSLAVVPAVLWCLTSLFCIRNETTKDNAKP